MASDTEARWTQFGEAAFASTNTPQATVALFLGWMQGFHGHLIAIFKGLGSSDAEFQEYWESVARIFCKRFRSDLLDVRYPILADDVFGSRYVESIVHDVDGTAEAFRIEQSEGKEAALNRAVAAVRFAEAKESSAPSGLSDSELKELIRESWDADLEDEEGQSSAGGA